MQPPSSPSGSDEPQLLGTNVFSEMTKSISAIDDEALDRLVLYEKQPGDHEYDRVSPFTVRALFIFYHLHQESEDFQHALHAQSRHERLVSLIDEAVDECRFAFEFFLRQLRLEQFHKWRGPTIFTIRRTHDGYVAVIRAKDRSAYRRHTKFRPYSDQRLLDLYRSIALGSIKQVRTAPPSSEAPE